MIAKDVMTANVISVGPETLVKDIAKIMLDWNVSALPVVDDDQAVVGIVSEGDLMGRIEPETKKRRSWWLSLLDNPEQEAARYVRLHGRHAKDVMTRPVITVNEDAPLAEVAQLLEENRIKRVPVVSDAGLVGIVSRANLLHGLASAKVSRPTTPEDQTIRSAILDTLGDEAGVENRFINVIVSNGVVELWGAVETEAERQAARVVAENADGVSAVEDHLGVLPIEVRRVLGAE